MITERGVYSLYIHVIIIHSVLSLTMKGKFRELHNQGIFSMISIHLYLEKGEYIIFFLLRIIYFIVHMSVLPLCIYMYHTVQCQRPKEVGCLIPWKFWELNLGRL